jgi:phage terminase large subunit
MLTAFIDLKNLQSKKITSDNTKDKLHKLQTNIPSKLIPFMESRRMYQILYGGRSSAKTRTALAKILYCANEKPNQTILCTREFQSSIETSTYAELKQIIFEEDLQHIFKVKHDRIECVNGSKFIFKGLARDIYQIKSIPNIDICLVEEAETIRRDLWDVLDPTLRKDGAQLIVLFNPRELQSATYQKWLIDKIPDEDILRIEINYQDNPFNSELILKKIAHMKEFDYARYEHIYLGKVLDISEDVIFKGKFKILDMGLQFKDERFYYKEKQIGMLYGMDFGFSQDPTAMIELCFLDEDTIYINREIFKTGLLPAHYIPVMEKEFGKFVRMSPWYADAARPDSIAQLKHDGLRRIEGAPKGKGSIESGIEYLLGKNIIINPRCQNMIFEAYNYRYKKDKNSGIVLSDIVDAHNHGWDAIRYALWKQISAIRGKSILSAL